MNCGKESEIKYISNHIMKQSIGDFVNVLEEYAKNPCWRHIQVSLNAKGAKIPQGEKNNMSIDDIQQDRGLTGLNTYSIYVKYIPHLYVIDYDVKDPECKLYDKLNDDCVAMTETKKGTHYYVLIPDMPSFTNQQKIHINTAIDMDLIKKNNIWETKDRIVNGSLIEYKWDDIKHYFNESKMGIKSSAKQTKQEYIEEDIPFDMNKYVSHGATCSEEAFKKHINSFKPRYSYGDWLKVGMVCYNNFKGSDIGMKYWNDYSKDDEENYEGKKALKLKYETFNGSQEKKVSYKLFIAWSNEDYPVKNIYEKAYKDGTLIDLMNEENIFYDGLIIDTRVSDNYNKLKLWKEATRRSYYRKYNFNVEGEDKKQDKFKLFDYWLDHIERRSVDEIVFKPRGDHTEDEYNLWNGYDYAKTDLYDSTNVELFKNHIIDVWADGDQDMGEWLLNWLAHIIQKPYQKTGIIVALQSRQGVGKTLIMNIMRKMMGERYTLEVSSLEKIFGKFNSGLERKILVNLNETGWGKAGIDMKANLNALITDDKVCLEKKGQDAIAIDNYVNILLTTNEDWVVPAEKDSRRYNIIRCNGDKRDKAYYKELAQTNLQDLFNFLSTRDISQWKIHDFKRSTLYLDQIEKNLKGYERFWRDCLDGHIYVCESWYDSDNKIDHHYALSGYNSYDNYCESDQKDFLYSRYYKSTAESHKLNRAWFWRHMRDMCPSIHITTNGKVSYPPLETATKEWKSYLNCC